VSDIIHKFRDVQERISRAAEKAGRSVGEITLVAISKTFPGRAVEEAIAAGLCRFGENRVQEAELKINQLGRCPGIEWHLVGHLQTNKAKKAAELFDCIHSVDSLKLANKLGQACVELGKTLPVLLEVKTSEEQSKGGADPGAIQTIVEGIRAVEGLRLEGLMTVPPYFEDPERARPYFSALRQLRNSIVSEYPGCLGKGHLSMGMSHDFEVAIDEGATIIRVGTALFGERQYD
jgi:PLP dependent protein